jgi:hypothetical protein
MKNEKPAPAATTTKLPSELMLMQGKITPTQGQYKLLKLWDNFILNRTTDRLTFLLKGYAVV